MNKLLLVLVAFIAFSMPAFAAVDLNTASKAELENIKGIGPAKAQAIIDYRKKHGAFMSLDDLKNVKGFGDKTVEKIRAELTIGGVKAEAREDRQGGRKGADNKAGNKEKK